MSKHSLSPMHVAGGYHLLANLRNGGGLIQIATFAKDDGFEAEQQANIELIVEAFDVATETGLTPRQLADQRKELMARFSALLDLIESSEGAYCLDSERASIVSMGRQFVSAGTGQ